MYEYVGCRTLLKLDYLKEIHVKKTKWAAQEVNTIL